MSEGVMGGEELKLPALQKECTWCFGSGGNYSEPGRCKKCNGSGWEPTAAGKQVLDLMQNHFSKFLLEREIP